MAGEKAGREIKKEAFAGNTRPKRLLELKAQHVVKPVNQPRSLLSKPSKNEKVRRACDS